MNRIHISAILLLAVLFLAPAQGRAQERNRSGQREPQAPVIQPSWSDVRYGAARPELPDGDPSCDRLLDIYLPSTPKPAAGYPVVVFIHGGGFSGGDKAMKPGVGNIGASLVENGFALVSINYLPYRKILNQNRDQGQRQEQARRSRQEGQGQRQGQGQGQRPQRDPNRDIYAGGISESVEIAADDAILALQFLQEHASEYSLDMNRLALSGGSAGAMTCLVVAYERNLASPKIRAIVDCWGALKDASVIQAPGIPTLTIHGTDDPTVPYTYGHAVQARLAEVGNEDSVFVTMEGRGHAQYRYVAAKLMGIINAWLKDNL